MGRNMKKFAALMAPAMLLAGCATSSGVVTIGPDTFMMSKQAGSGFGGQGTLKADLFREGGAYCASQGKVLQVVNTSENAGPYILGNYPRAEIQFMCLSPNDPSLQRPKLQPSAGQVIELRNR